ncbi:MAG: NAD(P)H-dependent oxidoreductase [Myxococcales bacterium FL481]|nr:MAG: NAD(P)H-dependent oxidoreductase [Myxococcales bacterium FL481]
MPRGYPISDGRHAKAPLASRRRMPKTLRMSATPRRTFPPSPIEARVLVLHGHPNPGSFNRALAGRYVQGLARSGLRVDEVDVDALAFDLRLRGPDFGAQELEPALLELQAQIARAAHLVVASPVWWGSVPASFKGMIDRVFLPGWAYLYGDAATPQAGLKGRSARVLLTMDAPSWWDRFVYGRSASRQLERAWLRFVGIQSYGVTRFTGIKNTDSARRDRMLDRVEALGARDASQVRARFPRVAATSHPVGADEATAGRVAR